MALTVTDADLTPGSISSATRLYVYASVGAAALLIGLASARPGLAAYGAPLLVLAVTGVALARRANLALTVAWGPERVVEGDQLVLRLRGRVVPAVGRLDVLALHRGPLVVPNRSGVLAVALTPAAVIDAQLRTDTDGWGLARIDRVEVRASGPLELVRQDWLLPTATAARVLPRPETLRAMLDPASRAIAGVHSSRGRGAGTDFAELRPIAPGDRLVDVNWLASARRVARAGGQRGQLDLVVSVRHPERTGDVVVLLDTLADDRLDAAPWLAATAAAAWTVAGEHFAAHDRVGLVALGGYPRWVTPGVGRAARYALLDALLSAQASWSAVDRTLTGTPVHLLPPSALVVAISPLHDRRFAAAAIDLRRQGRDVVVLAIDASVWLPPLTGPAALAGRLWNLVLDNRVAELERVGVPVARWQGREDGTTIAAAVAALRRRRRARVRVRP